MLRTDQIEAAAEFAGAISDPTRARIFAILREGEMNVGMIVGALGLPQPTVSHHLGILRRMKIAVAKRRGKRIFYSAQRHAEGREELASLVK